MENIETAQNLQNAQGVVLVREENKKNTAAGVGLVCAILGLLFCWLPGLGWVLWLTGLIGSIIGLFKNPRGKAIAGLLISFIDVFILIGLIGAIALG